MTEITDYLFRAFDLVWLPLAPFFESAFWISLVGALGGAYFGAKAAQDLAARKQDKDELTKHINATNYAIILCSSVLEFYIGLKRQHVMRMVEHQKMLRTTFDTYHAGLRDGSIAKGGELALPLDMEVLTIFTPPLSVLRTQLVEKVQVTRSRVIRLHMAMEQSAQSLAEFFSMRNQWINDYRRAPFPDNELPNRLFGIPYKSGNIDASYPSCLDGIAAHCDDAIFFGHLLCIDLQEHAKELRQQYIKGYGLPAPRMQTVAFEKSIEEGVIPDKARYESWFTNFETFPPYRTKSQRVVDWFKHKLKPNKLTSEEIMQAQSGMQQGRK